jgi:hypothetical protein
VDERPWLEGLRGTRRAVAKSRPARPKPEDSPYFDTPSDKWHEVTEKLLQQHPLHPQDVVEIVLSAWSAIFRSQIGEGFLIGQHIFPAPQILGFFLHELIPLECERRFPGAWRVGRTSNEKDLVCVADDSKSIEIKTSSNANRIFANRSYGQESDSGGKKAKDGYYIAVNFDPWPKDLVVPRDTQVIPDVRLVRFGWLDHTDWLPQTAATGQQSSLPAEVESNQLLRFFPLE